MMPVRLEHAAPRSLVKHSTTEPLHSQYDDVFSTVTSIVYSYFMPVCSIVKTNTPRCLGRPDALLHEAEGRVQ